jgi:plastocyanin
MKILAIVLVLGLVLAGCAQTGNPGTPSGNATSPTPPAGNASGGSGIPAGPGNTVTVKIQGFAFNPADVSVSQGDTVEWVNEDGAPHIVKFAGFESGTLAQGGKFSHTFTEGPGEYPYSCAIHASMLGKVTVTK